jgi:hypothetical protein
MRGRRGGEKGVPRYKTLALRPRAVRTYYWIQQFVKDNGRPPTYYEIGALFDGSDNHWTMRNRGIKAIKPLLAQGFLVREGYGRGSKIKITDKPFTEVNIVIPTSPKPRH